MSTISVDNIKLKVHYIEAANIDNNAGFSPTDYDGKNIVRDSNGYLYSIIKDASRLRIFTPGISAGTYYFDGSDEAANVTSGSFTAITNVDDGYTYTTSSSSTNGSVAIVGGTNAPSSGDSIFLVRARLFGGHGGVAGVSAEIFTDGKAESLGTVIDDINLSTDDSYWGEYKELSTPTGGWTWAKLQALEAEISVFAISGSIEINRIEFEVITSRTTNGKNVWYELDQAHTPSCQYSCALGVAIDSSDIIHIGYRENATTADYQTFNTSTGLWGTSEEISNVSNTEYECFAIAIDSNDKPHFFTGHTNGSTYSGGIKYTNKISGSWKSLVSIRSTSYTSTVGIDATINLNDIPAAVYYIAYSGDAYVEAVLGNNNDATSFLIEPVAGGIGSDGYSPTIAIDSSNDAWIAHNYEGTITIAKQSSNWTDTWTEYTNSNNGTGPSLYIDANDNKYIFYANDDTDTKISYDKYNGSWSGETILQETTTVDYSFPKVRYGSIIENDSTGSIVTPSIIDSYDTSNYSSTWEVYSPRLIGQSFTNTNLSTLNNVSLYIKRKGTISGNAYIKIYAHSGTYGTSSLPTGSALATSDAVDVTTISNSVQENTQFNFTGSNRIALSSSTNYVLVLEYTGGTDTSNCLEVQRDSTTTSHSGNNSYSFNSGSSWSSNPTVDLIFYVNAIENRLNPAEIDYTFTNGTDIFYSSLTLSTTVDKTIQAKARIKSTGVTKTIQAKADVKKLATTKIVQSKANINGLRVGGTTLVSPDHIGSGASPVVFVWEIATNSLDEPVHSQIQIDDTSSAFGSLEIDQKSWEDNTGMEYWNGSSWVEYPLTGVTSADFGNQARLTVTLTDTQKWWRVRGASG